MIFVRLLVWRYTFFPLALCKSVVTTQTVTATIRILSEAKYIVIKKSAENFKKKLSLLNTMWRQLKNSQFNNNEK